VTQVTAGTNSPYNGWQMIGTQAVNKGVRTVWAFKVAASAAEGNVTYTAGNNDWIGASYVYRYAHATLPFGSLVDGT
ncbi:hypothetical protein, partial [Streptococcus pneumoniae]|uniref:hypothetical protein n=1 Tax=Streptococcus pneumoniae TaxID=1313 RepID=UPI001E5488EA